MSSQQSLCTLALLIACLVVMASADGGCLLNYQQADCKGSSTRICGCINLGLDASTSRAVACASNNTATLSTFSVSDCEGEPSEQAAIEIGSCNAAGQVSHMYTCVASHTTAPAAAVVLAFAFASFMFV
eukprot:m.25342 g.25342  ORF g.25342 m.25342 type:complete len:129 (-) comp11588_c0_seq1:887-1273(-)